MWTKARIFVLFLLATCVYISNQAAVMEADCPLPEMAQEWDSNPEESIVDVYWSTYDEEVFCSSKESCNLTMPTNSSSNFTKEEDHMKWQLIPVELQPGNKLKFYPSSMDNSSFPFIYKVNEKDFLNCDIAGWSPIIRERTDQPFEVLGQLLRAGNNYFIVENDGAIRCDIGLRLNVTVKTDSCHYEDSSHMCGGRGRCVTFRGSPRYTCHCCGNYRGKDCEIYDVCVGQPCRNGGECLHKDITNSTHLEDYYCKCPFGYYGNHCEKKAKNICDIIECHNNATCTGNTTDFECVCPLGFTGTHCEVEINECATFPCRHGLCIDRLNGYDCECYPGYFGPTCEEKRTPCTPNPCRNGGFCENTTVSDEFSFQCHCRPMWTGGACMERASPCESSPCSVHGICIEENDDFTCQCEPGFIGSRCEVNINECDPNPCRYHGHCRDLINGHYCLCLHTHPGSNCQYTIDIFNPVLDDIDAIDRATRLNEENENLYIVAAVLSALVIALIAVLLYCYCRRSESYREFCGKRIPSLYRKPPSSDGLTVSVDASNALDCPLTSDSFFRCEPSCGAVSNPAFENQVV